LPFDRRRASGSGADVLDNPFVVSLSNHNRKVRNDFPINTSGGLMSRISPETRFPWYDSNWLGFYVSAKAYMAEHCPERLPNFVDAIAPLRTRSDFETVHLGGLLGSDVLARIRSAIAELKPAALELHEIKSFGRWVVHDDPILTELQATMTALVSAATGERVVSSYNFLSLYSRLGRCPVHMDAPYAKWTLDICIDQSEPWPIHFSQVQPWPESADYSGESWDARIRADPANRFTAQMLAPGEAVVFSGSSQWHYRDPLPAGNRNSFCHLLFFHFVPEGVNAFIDPSDWEAYFGIPGLSEALGNPQRAQFAG
jgi:hypothetical protein